MKLIAYGPGGVLENVHKDHGLRNLCLLTADDPELVQCTLDAVRFETLVRYYKIAATFPTVGACIDNDDWGFKTPTMLPPRTCASTSSPGTRGSSTPLTAPGARDPALLRACRPDHRRHGRRDRNRRAALLRGHHPPVEKAYERYRAASRSSAGSTWTSSAVHPLTRCMRAPRPCSIGPPAGAATPWAPATASRSTSRGKTTWR